MTTTARNQATLILLLLDLVFFVTAVFLTLHGVSESLNDKVWEAFAGANGALYLLLKSDSQVVAAQPSPNPITPADPAQPQQ